MEKIITSRPENMSFEKYKKLRREQTLIERRRKKTGDLVYLSSEIFKNEITGVKMKRTYPPAIKTTDNYGKVEYVPMKIKKLE